MSFSNLTVTYRALAVKWTLCSHFI